VPSHFEGSVVLFHFLLFCSLGPGFEAFYRQRHPRPLLSVRDRLFSFRGGFLFPGSFRVRSKAASHFPPFFFLPVNSAPQFPSTPDYTRFPLFFFFFFVSWPGTSSVQLAFSLSRE